MDLWRETGVRYVAEDITVTRFDSYNDLVWIGTRSGEVASFSGPLLQPYVSFVAHESPVLDLQISDRLILSLGEDGIAAHKRSGLLSARNKSARGDRLLLLDNTEFLVSYKRRVAKYTTTPKIKEIGFFQIDSIPDGVNITHISRCVPNVALGLSNGTIEIVEPKTFDVVLQKPLVCHTGAITDLDSQKNLLVSCGLSQRRFGVFPDVFISCYDARFRKTLPPLTASNGATFVRLHPKSPNHTIVLGSRGQLTFLDSRNPSSINIRQLILQENAEALEIGSLGDALVVSEKRCIHFWSNRTTPNESFKGLDVPTAMGPLPSIDLDLAPLSAVGMPYYNQELLSSWSPERIFEVGLPPQLSLDDTLNPLVAESYESSLQRRQNYRKQSAASVPRFLSEQARLGSSPSSAHFAEDVRQAEALLAHKESEHSKIPKLWRRMHVHYSKFGVDDFDFSYYNQTPYSSLEPLTGSPFCNALLQLYRWCPSVYNHVLSVFAENNHLDIQATGELAVVLDMLHVSKGYHCRATNLMDTLQLDMRLNAMHLHLMNLLELEFKQEIGSDTTLLDSTGTVSVSSFDMLSEAPAAARVQLQTLPQSLFVLVENVDEQGSVPLPSTLMLYEPHPEVLDDEEEVLEDTAEFEYNLVGYAAEIAGDSERHGVAVIKIKGEWFLFNDFLVTQISEQDALDFKVKWKRPTMFMYLSQAEPQEFDQNWLSKLDSRLLTDPVRISGNLEAPIDPSSLLKPGESVPELVALDAEFVLVRKELAEMHSDGTKLLVSPKKLSLARVSVLRDDESVLIDDIVESRQKVVDYLTAYSGVEPGDLDPLTSRHALVARKTATRRLWLLLKLGTKFVGHALVNDFRCINLYAPPSQVIDTVDLFYDRDRNGLRRLSLKFLMWAVLDEHVQLGNHDSVQDAQSALRLFRKYEELREAGQIDSMLAEVSIKGQKNNYRAPISAGDERK